MSNGLIISKYVRIGKEGINLNGEAVLTDVAAGELKEFMTSLYKATGLEYPKFFKMDNLCQLAFIGAELLLKDSIAPGKYPKEQIAILLSNSASSLDTDRRYHDTISNPDKYFPSPSVFVYTLASIMNGEIAIRHGVKGENSFLVSEKFDAGLLVSSVEDLFQFTGTQVCISGWVNVDGDSFEALMLVVERGEGKVFSAKDLASIYQP